jgi:hypothetical protein
MKLDVKRRIVSKFHQNLKFLGILNKFQSNSASSLLFWILIHIFIRIRESSNNKSCSSLQYLHLSILFKKIEPGKTTFRVKQSQ